MILKSLATFSFLAAILVAMRNGDTFPAFRASSEYKPVQNIENARPAYRNHRLAKERRKNLLVLAEKSRTALLEAAGLELPGSERVLWNAKKLDDYLHHVSDDDARELVRHLFASKKPGAQLVFPAEPISNSAVLWSTRSVINQTSHNSKYAVINGLLRELANRDFEQTLEFMDSIPEITQNRLVSQYIYETVLRAGSSQDPQRAWKVYLAKCSSLGFG